MKVLLIGNYVHDVQRSMQLFAALMFDSLAGAGHEVRLSRPGPVLGKLKPSNMGFGKWLGYVDQFAIFPARLKKDILWADIVHICDHANSIYVKYLQAKPHLVTCHDLLAVRSALGEISENRTSTTGRQLQRMILSGLRQSRHVVCVSEATRQDVLRLVGVPQSRVSTVYSSVNYDYSPMSSQDVQTHRRALGLDEQPFVLHVGGNQWYKNRLGTMQIFNYLRQYEAFHECRLLMVGRPWTDEMRQFVCRSGLTERVQELTNVGEEQLRALYGSAKLLLFPSLQEGFGWPILEAQACGCPVVTTDRAPMSEISGAAAILIDPTDPSVAAGKIASVPNLVSFRQAGLQNAARFSRSKMTMQYLEIYKALLQ